MATTNQNAPVVQEAYPASGAHYAAPGSREAYERYGIPPVMYQRSPYATAAFRTYVDPYGQMTVQPLIGFPSRYPHVVSGVPTDSLARAMSVAAPFMGASVAAPSPVKAAPAAPRPSIPTPAQPRTTQKQPALPRPAMAPSHEPYNPPQGRNGLKLSGELQPFSIPAPVPVPYIDGGAPYDTSGMDDQYGALVEQALLHAASPDANRVLSTPGSTAPTYSPESAWAGLGRFAARADSALREALGFPAQTAAASAPQATQAPKAPDSGMRIPVSPALQRAGARMFPSAPTGGNAPYRVEVPLLSMPDGAAAASPIATPELTTMPNGGRTLLPAHTAAMDETQLITPPAPGAAVSHTPVALPINTPVAPSPVYVGGYQEAYPRTPGAARPVITTTPMNAGEYWSRIQAQRLAEERALLPMLYRQLAAPMYTVDAGQGQALPSAVLRPAAQPSPVTAPSAVYYPAP